MKRRTPAQIAATAKLHTLNKTRAKDSLISDCVYILGYDDWLENFEFDRAERIASALMRYLVVPGRAASGKARAAAIARWKKAHATMPPHS